LNKKDCKTKKKVITKKQFTKKLCDAEGTRFSGNRIIWLNLLFDQRKEFSRFTATTNQNYGFEINGAKLCKTNDIHESTIQQKYESDSKRLTNDQLHHQRCTSPQAIQGASVEWH
jgi:hypothetical protein